MGIYVVIPAFNESKTIQSVLNDLKHEGYQNLVLVDDGSNDDTATKAQEITPHVLSHAVNRGQGAALATGVRYALNQGADAIVHLDGDAQHSITDIGRMLEVLISDRVDVVLGSRVLAGMRFTIHDKVKWIGKRFVDRLFTGMNLTDTHNGLRVMNRKAAELIHITQDRMAHATEILHEIRRNNLVWKEVPVTVRYDPNRKGTNASFYRASVKILRDLVVGRLLR